LKTNARLNDRWIAGLLGVLILLVSNGAALTILLQAFPLIKSSAVAESRKPAAPKKLETVAAQNDKNRVDEPAVLADVDLKQTVGTCIVVGVSGTKLDKKTAAALRNGEIGGVILMGANLTSDGQIRQLTADIRAAASEGGKPTPLICIDQEGGSVQRIKMGLPSAEEMARTPDKVREYGAEVGKKLAELGINVNFAPVLDLTTPGSTVLAGRTFSADPAETARLGGDFAVGLKEAGILAIGKHFPGHGLVKDDTHDKIAVSNAGKNELNRHLRAFKLAAPQLDGLMLSHIVYNGWDKEKPASLSPVLSALATEMVPNGITFTDAADMKALQKFGTDAERASLALGNGTNVFLTIKPLSTLGPNFTSRVAEQISARKFDAGKLRASAIAVSRIRGSLANSSDRTVPEETGPLR
jgi:beta-N-acetylhexosaminidase